MIGERSRTENGISEICCTLLMPLGRWSRAGSQDIVRYRRSCKTQAPAGPAREIGQESEERLGCAGEAFPYRDTG